MNPHNPYIKFLIGMVAVAAAIRLTWELLRPALVPSLIAVVVLGLVLLARRWW